MNEVLAQINLHEFLTGAVLGAALTWLLSALAWALPKPEEVGSLWYRTLYRLLQFAVANLPAARKPVYPETKDGQ